MDNELPFLGTGWSFPPQFNKLSNTVEMVSGKKDIEESLRILISTQLGERILEPEFGCSLKDLVFEPIDSTLIVYIENLITTSITYHEPRVIIENLKITEAAPKGSLVIEFEYLIPRTNSRSNFVFNYYLNEGTEIELTDDSKK